MENEKMARMFERLRFDRQRRRGDFLRPRSVPAEVWKRAVRTYGSTEALHRAETGRL
jgi:hypothetical protein